MVRLEILRVRDGSFEKRRDGARDSVLTLSLSALSCRPGLTPNAKFAPKAVLHPPRFVALMMTVNTLSAYVAFDTTPFERPPSQRLR